MKISETLGEIASALAKAQSAIPTVKFDSDNKHFGSRYASLNAVVEAIREPLRDNDLSIVQEPYSEESNGKYFVGVETTLLHKSGEYISECVSLPVMDLEMLTQFTARKNRDGDLYFTSPNVLQEFGKVVTYLRRYGIVSILRISAEEDTDGEEQPTTSKPDQEKQATSETAHVTQKKVSNKRPYSPEELVKALAKSAEKSQPCTDKDRQTIAAVLSSATDGTEHRHELQKYLFGVESVKEADPKLVTAAMRWLTPAYNSNTNGYVISEVALEELKQVSELVKPTEETLD